MYPMDGQLYKEQAEFSLVKSKHGNRLLFLKLPACQMSHS